MGHIVLIFTLILPCTNQQVIMAISIANSLKSFCCPGPHTWDRQVTLATFTIKYWLCHNNKCMETNDRTFFSASTLILDHYNVSHQPILQECMWVDELTHYRNIGSNHNYEFSNTSVAVDQAADAVKVS